MISVGLKFFLLVLSKKKKIQVCLFFIEWMARVLNKLVSVLKIIVS